jgi:hypothetical protein
MGCGSQLSKYGELNFAWWRGSEQRATHFIFAPVEILLEQQLFLIALGAH